MGGGSAPQGGRNPTGATLTRMKRQAADSSLVLNILKQLTVWANPTILHVGKLTVCEHTAATHLNWPAPALGKEQKVQSSSPEALEFVIIAGF